MFISLDLCSARKGWEVTIAQGLTCPPPLFSCAQAAERAGAAEPAAAMKKVRARADRELDKAKTPQERLMSQLLRSPTAELRKELLTKAFEAKESLLLAAGDEELKAPAPEVYKQKGKQEG